MVTLLSFLARYLPFWAAPLCWISYEAGKYYYNHRNRLRTALFFGTFSFCLITLILWIIFNGYKNGGIWIRTFFNA